MHNQHWNKMEKNEMENLLAAVNEVRFWMRSLHDAKVKYAKANYAIMMHNFSEQKEREEQKRFNLLCKFFSGLSIRTLHYRN